MDLNLIRAIASYHRAVTGLFWMLEDALDPQFDGLHPVAWQKAIRKVLTTHVVLQATELQSQALRLQELRS